MGFAKRKRGLILIGLFIIMIAFIIAYYFLKSNKEEEENAKLVEENKNISLSSFQAEDIIQIDYQNASARMTFLKQGNKWKNKEDNNFPVNQEKIEEILNNASNLSANRLVVKEAKDLEQYGLLSPEIAVSFLAKDNKKTTFYLGNTVPIEEGGRYFTKDKETIVYTIDEFYYTIFSYTETQMMAVEKIPSVSEENLINISIQKKDKIIFEVEKDKEREAASDYNYWNILKPYEKAVIGDTNNLTTFFSYYGGLSYKECVEYKANDFSQYGLKDPNTKITITYYKTEKEKQFVLLIGNKNETGDYYVKPQNSKAVYLMERAKVTSLLPKTAYEYINHSLVLENNENVNRIQITIEGKTYEMRKETDVYYLNNKEIEATSYLNFYQKILDLQTAKEKEEEQKEGSIYMEIIINAKSGQQAIRFLQYDENYYLIEMDGIKEFLIEKRVIDDLAESILQL